MMDDLHAAGQWIAMLAAFSILIWIFAKPNGGNDD
jgi:hypothetical protein